MSYFNMSQADYGEYVKGKSPNSRLGLHMLCAFLIGGLICTIGQGLLMLYKSWMDEESAATLVSITMIFLGALLTGLGVYDDIAVYGGAGTLVPITGFANAMVSPALEFKTEGYVTGTASKMFIIAGPVIVYGISASIIYGIILSIFS